MEATINTYKCPACTGPLHFAAGSGKLECEYCGSSYEVAEVEAFYGKKAAPEPELTCPACNAALNSEGISGEATCPSCGAEFTMEDLRAYAAQMAENHEDNMNWDTAAGGAWQDGEADGLRIYGCKQCGGEIVADETTGATHCPYCGNPVVLTGHFAGLLKPDLVIPFKVDKKAAVEALKNHYKGKPLLPKNFTSQQRLEKITGIYVPFWLYDCGATFDGSYKATRIHRWSDSRYNYTKTDHFLLRRKATADFSGIPMDGSAKMDDTFMESIEPYDYSQLTDFDTAYLSGYLADIYDVPSEDGKERIRQRVDRSMEEELQTSLLGYATAIPVTKQLSIDHSKARYVLLPVWMLNTRYQDKIYTFAMNGQTGKMTGSFPVCPKRSAAWFGGIFAGVTLLSAVIQLLM